MRKTGVIFVYLSLFQLLQLFSLMTAVVFSFINLPRDIYRSLPNRCHCDMNSRFINQRSDAVVNAHL